MPLLLLQIGPSARKVFVETFDEPKGREVRIVGIGIVEALLRLLRTVPVPGAALVVKK